MPQGALLQRLRVGRAVRARTVDVHHWPSRPLSSLLMRFRKKMQPSVRSRIAAVMPKTVKFWGGCPLSSNTRGMTMTSPRNAPKIHSVYASLLVNRSSVLLGQSAMGLYTSDLLMRSNVHVEGRA